MTDYGSKAVGSSKTGMVVGLGIGVGIIAAAISGVLIWLYVFRKNTLPSSSSSSSTVNAMKMVKFANSLEKKTQPIKNAISAEPSPR
jgi:hypothetical protein